MRYIALVLSILILCLSCTSTEAFVSPSFSAQDVSVEEKLLSVGGVPVSVPNPEIFFDGALWLERFTELVEEADDYILITTFLGSDCPELDDLYHALMEAAERGVRVYFIKKLHDSAVFSQAWRCPPDGIQSCDCDPSSQSGDNHHPRSQKDACRGWLCSRCWRNEYELHLDGGGGRKDSA